MNKVNKKNLIDKLLIILAINVSLSISAMDDRHTNESISAEDYECFIQVKSLEIAQKIYSSQSFIKHSNIFEAVEQVYKKIKKLKHTFSNEFYDADGFKKLRENAFKSYQELLKKYFLEKRKNKEGLYPKGEEWGFEELDEKIAQFIENPEKNNPILFNLFHHCYNFDISTPPNLVKLLLIFGADPNLKVNSKRAPLNFAALKNQKENLQLLLDFGADINNQDSWGDTALTIAIFYNYYEMAEILLSERANIYLSGFRGNAIELAKKYNDPKYLNLLGIKSEPTMCVLY